MTYWCPRGTFYSVGARKSWHQGLTATKKKARNGIITPLPKLKKYHTQSSLWKFIPTLMQFFHVQQAVHEWLEHLYCSHESCVEKWFIFNLFVFKKLHNKKYLRFSLDSHSYKSIKNLYSDVVQKPTFLFPPITVSAYFSEHLYIRWLLFTILFSKSLHLYN